MRILFIVKRNETYGFKTYCRKNSGLWNSTEFVASALRSRGYHAHVAEVTDNNDIDREVTAFNPHVVIIEALWVVPEKFDILKQLHPGVKWYCHLHSNMSFLASEGIAVAWLKDYYEQGLDIIVNSEFAKDAVSIIIDDSDAVHFCPNVYARETHAPKCAPAGTHINIGCFGAVRPLKNQLNQAIAALSYAKQEGKYLRFHMNGSRVEHGACALRNIEALFSADNAELILHPWYEHDTFMHVLRHEIDLGMQVSLSETFNIVTADYVAAGLPVVVSSAISWISRWNQVPCEDSLEITEGIRRVWGGRLLTRWNQRLLRNYSADALKDWVTFLQGI